MANDRVWRIREISALHKQCTTSSISDDTRATLRKAFIAMIYAHWEGFVKSSADYYLEFVAMQGMKMNEIHSSFLSLYFKNQILLGEKSNKNSVMIDFCDSLVSNSDKVIKITHKNVINTHDNLNSKVLVEILICLGLDTEAFETKHKFIDRSLVARRNNIAHGNYEKVDEEEMEEVKRTVIEIMETFRTLVENAATEKRFARPAGKPLAEAAA
nr:MAE_28990/MAE_18760 family HEPN-like nuclease [Mesorhizobium sp. B2-4-11]